MRRWAGFLMMAAVACSAGSLNLFIPNSPVCAMACHANGAAEGAVCCRVNGADGPVLKLCGESRDGVPLPPACRLAAPRLADVLPSPAFNGRALLSASASPISRSPEPADPVPLRLS